MTATQAIQNDRFMLLEEYKKVADRMSWCDFLQKVYDARTPIEVRCRLNKASTVASFNALDLHALALWKEEQERVEASTEGEDKT